MALDVLWRWAAPGGPPPVDGRPAQPLAVTFGRHFTVTEPAATAFHVRRRSGEGPDQRIEEDARPVHTLWRQGGATVRIRCGSRHRSRRTVLGLDGHAVMSRPPAPGYVRLTADRDLAPAGGVGLVGRAVPFHVKRRSGEGPDRPLSVDDASVPREAPRPGRPSFGRVPAEAATSTGDIPPPRGTNRSSSQQGCRRPRHAFTSLPTHLMWQVESVRQTGSSGLLVTVSPRR